MDATRLLPVWRLAPLVRSDEARLAWATPALLDDHTGEPPVFLGVSGPTAHFALDLSAEAEPLESYGWDGVAEFPELRAIVGRLAPGEAAIAGAARHLLDWHARHGHCPGCGARTLQQLGGWSRRCIECSIEHFPRTDPVVIMLVTNGDSCLLGRQTGWPPGMHSALAGYVEPGETLEEAVAREVYEEVGVEIGPVEYLFSQPWPFPASLMLGCRTEARTTELRVDRHELESAAWYARETVRRALEAPTPELAVPPPIAIAHHLLRRWLER